MNQSSQEPVTGAIDKTSTEKASTDKPSTDKASNTDTASRPHIICIEETGFLQVKQCKLFYRLWRPKASQDTKMLLHINHGMAEHSARYACFAQRCVEIGIAVIAQDHPGHGQSIEGPSHLGHIADKNSWKLLTKCVKATQDLGHQLFGDIPTLVLGHSMGSFATLNLLEQDFISDKLQTNGLPLAGVILSGSTQNPWYLNKSLQLVARLERWRQGGKGKSKLINRLTFAGFNRKFSPNRTKADWLSSDTQAVDAYMQDPLCGEQSSNQTWLDLAEGLLQVFKQRNLKKLPVNTPFLLISGDQDPLSDHGGLHRLEQSLISAGVKHITTKTFPHGRHELLNEINHEEVENTIFQWVETLQLN
jgi:alpha-beta hydrolase superfamily lysophospholipase